MAKFIIQGGKKLKGRIDCRGAKNATTPILIATLLSAGEYRLANIPRLEDINRVLEILKSLGSKCEWTGDHNLQIVTPSALKLANLNITAVKRLRSSVLLMGGLASFFNDFSLPVPGGCFIGARPVDAHIKALTELGLNISYKDDNYCFEKKGRLKGTKIVMSEFSVTATENLLLAAVLAEGVTVIKCAAAEYSVGELGRFLNKMGAKISGLGTHTLIINGVSCLHPADYEIMPDLIEAGTFIALAAATDSNITIGNVVPEMMEMELQKFKEAGCRFVIKNLRDGYDRHYQLADLEVSASCSLQPIKPKLHCMPYPGLASDLLPLFAVLLTQAQGITSIQEWMYEGRFKYVDDLVKMGANITICDPHRIIVSGPTPLFGREITSFDLRAGATLIIAALLAEGESVINNAYQVDRGYEKLDERLRALGADIQRVEEKDLFSK